MTIEQYKKAGAIVSELHRLDDELERIEYQRKQPSVIVEVSGVEFHMDKARFRSVIALRFTTAKKRRKDLEEELSNL